MAGSTVLMLTVPWFMSVLGGQMPIVRGEVRYAAPQANDELYLHGSRCSSYGVSPHHLVRSNAIVMLVTGLLCYSLVEIPALMQRNSEDKDEVAAAKIHPYVLAGTVVCAVCCLCYIQMQRRMANADDEQYSAEARLAKAMRKAMSDRKMNLRTALRGAKSLTFTRPAEPENTLHAATLSLPMDVVHSTARDAMASFPLGGRTPTQWYRVLKEVTLPHLMRYDADHNGRLSRGETYCVLNALGEETSEDNLDALFARADENGNVGFQHFNQWLTSILVQERSATFSTRPLTVMSLHTFGDDEEEQHFVKHDGCELPPETQYKLMTRRASLLMAAGTLIVLVFSDPMVDVLETIGLRTGIPPFFVAFIGGPLASNVSEIWAAYQFAQKKTKKSITVSFQQLLGAACMNNTFCLMVFYLIIAVRGFPWVYHAEVLGILFAEAAMCLLTLKKVHSIFVGCLVLCILPVSMMLVFCLQAVFNEKED